MSATLLKKRLIPKLLVKHRRVGGDVRPVLVTTRQYRDVLDVGDAVSQAKIYEAQLADELAVLNIDGTHIGRDEAMLALIERLATETFMPLTVGGGVREIGDFALLLERGADKVCINELAFRRPDFVSEAAARFGAQCVVVSIDFRTDATGRAVVHTRHAGVPEHADVLEFAVRVARAGAGEILLTDADRDGMGSGLNCGCGRAVAAAVPVPVILSGGCGLAEHFVEGFRDGGAEAIAAGTYFCFRDQNPMQTRAHIRNAGIAIRTGT